MRSAALILAGLFGALELFVACSNDTAPDAGSSDAMAEAEGDGAITDGTRSMDASDAPDPDAGSCEASADDPRNCGRCAHDCIGGACEAGVCLPWVVTAAPASDLVSNNADVYWVYGSAAGSLGTCPRTGCEAGTILVANAPRPTRIASGDGGIYYTTYLADGGYLATYDDGGALILSGAHANPSALVVDMTDIFFHVDDKDIFRCTLPTCGNGAVSATSTSSARGLAQEWNILYWTETQSTVWSCQKGSCDSTRKLIGSGFTNLRAVGAYGGNVFPVQGGANGKVLRCPNVNNCNPVTIGGNLDDPDDIEVDWTGIYFLTHGIKANDASLAYCPLGGCQGKPLVLIGGLASVNSLTLDQDAVYVATTTTIFGVAKP